MTVFLKFIIYRFLTHHLHYVNALFAVHFLAAFFTSMLLQKVFALKLLQYLHLLPALKYSGISYTLNQCSVNQIAAIYLHFHCTFTASISSVIRDNRCSIHRHGDITLLQCTKYTTLWKNVLSKTKIPQY